MIHSNKTAGFTLIEIVAVVLIIGIMFSAVLVSFDRITPKYRLRSEARELSNFVEFTRVLAAQEGRSYMIHYDLDNSQYWREPNVIPPLEDEEKEPEKRTLPKSIVIQDIDLGGDNVWDAHHPSPLVVSPQGALPVHAIHMKLTGDVPRAWTIAFTGPAGAPVLEYGYKTLRDLVQDDPPDSEDSYQHYIQKNQ